MCLACYANRSSIAKKFFFLNTRLSPVDRMMNCPVDDSLRPRIVSKGFNSVFSRLLFDCHDCHHETIWFVKSSELWATQNMSIMTVVSVIFIILPKIIIALFRVIKLMSLILHLFLVKWKLFEINVMINRNYLLCNPLKQS